MAGTVQAVQLASDTGIAPNDIHASIVALNEAPINARVILIVKATASPVNITLQNYITVDGMALPDRVVNIPANNTKIIGPMPAPVYSLADNNFEFDVDVPANIASMFIIEIP